MASSCDAYVVVYKRGGDPQKAAQQAALVFITTEGGENLGNRTFCPVFTELVAKQAEKYNPGLVTRNNFKNAYIKLVIEKEHESYKELNGELPDGWTNVTHTEAEDAETAETAATLLTLSSFYRMAQKMGSLKKLYKKA